MTLPEAIEIVDEYRTARREEKPFVYNQETINQATDVVLIAAKTYNKIVQITNVSYSVTK